MCEGRLVYVMGASGAGKDSLIAHARRFCGQPEASSAHLPLFFARRYITRPADAGGEEHTSLSLEEFALYSGLGLFALQWESHGLHYGIRTDINDHLAQGHTVVMNGSRAYLPHAARLYPSLTPLLITVRPDALRARLEARNRETPAQIEERLSGALMPLPEYPSLVRLDNSGDFSETGRNFITLLERIANGQENQHE